MPVLVSDLDPAARSTELRALASVVPAALHEGWHHWELPEQIKAAARQRGIELTDADVRLVLALSSA